MLAHQPFDLPLTGDFRFTDDTVEMKLANSLLWRDVSRLRDSRLDILDVPQGAAASQVIVEEAGMPVMLVVRLQITGGKIAEPETQGTRTKAEGSVFNPNRLEGTERPGCEDIKAQKIPTLSGITYRVAAVDEDLGIVLLRLDFGSGSSRVAGSVIVWEAFKVHGGTDSRGGSVHEEYAV